mgnify:CR=1 FL=1
MLRTCACGVRCLNMYKRLIFIFVLVSSYSYSDEYYGWAGSCEETIYDFNFKEGEYSVYGNNRSTRKGVERNQYFINTDKITMDESGNYHLQTKRDGPVSLNLEEKDERIWGKSKYGRALFIKCDKAKALKVVNTVKQNT